MSLSILDRIFDPIFQTVPIHGKRQRQEARDGRPKRYRRLNAANPAMPPREIVRRLSLMDIIRANPRKRLWIGPRFWESRNWRALNCQWNFATRKEVPVKAVREANKEKNLDDLLGIYDWHSLSGDSKYRLKFWAANRHAATCFVDAAYAYGSRSRPPNLVCIAKYKADENTSRRLRKFAKSRQPSHPCEDPYVAAIFIALAQGHRDIRRNLSADFPQSVSRFKYPVGSCHFFVVGRLDDRPIVCVYVASITGEFLSRLDWPSTPHRADGFNITCFMFPDDLPHHVIARELMKIIGRVTRGKMADRGVRLPQMKISRTRYERWLPGSDCRTIPEDAELEFGECPRVQHAEAATKGATSEHVEAAEEVPTVKHAETATEGATSEHEEAVEEVPTVKHAETATEGATSEHVEAAEEVPTVKHAEAAKEVPAAQHAQTDVGGSEVEHVEAAEQAGQATEADEPTGQTNATAQPSAISRANHTAQGSVTAQADNIAAEKEEEEENEKASEGKDEKRRKQKQQNKKEKIRRRKAKAARKARS
ncbi:hypothetical protein QBC44DRAFT_393486 [Cladorrhinum sp. PSN332]|nr:hypothetical protein QBC44DRAFT_393486 [Cladorrhinum sp. PSN332]